MIELKDITKNYGKLKALQGFSITLEQPGIYCLLGRNGAGKTTMLKTLAGHIAATSGEVIVNEKAVSTFDMPDDVHFVEANASQFNIRLKDLLHAAAEINPRFDYTFAMELACNFGLDICKRYNHLSFGMKAMTNTLLALASDKETLLLDEPVLGFDPIMRKAFYDMLTESCAEKPRLVIVSTHIIDEIAQVAERLIIIDKGRLLLFCEISELDEKAYCVTGPAEYVKNATEGLRSIGETNAGGFLSRNIYDRRIGGNDRVSVSALSLQDFFVSIVGNEKEVV